VIERITGVRLLVEPSRLTSKVFFLDRADPIVTSHRDQIVALQRQTSGIDLLGRILRDLHDFGLKPTVTYLPEPQIEQPKHGHVCAMQESGCADCDFGG